VASKTTLGELVNTLVGSTSASLDHIEDTALIRSKASNLPGNRAGEGDSLGDALRRAKREKKREVTTKERKVSNCDAKLRSTSN